MAIMRQSHRLQRNGPAQRAKPGNKNMQRLPEHHIGAKMQRKAAEQQTRRPPGYRKGSYREGRDRFGFGQHE